MKSILAADNELFWLLIIVLVVLALASAQQASVSPCKCMLAHFANGAEF